MFVVGGVRHRAVVSLSVTGARALQYLDQLRLSRRRQTLVEAPTTAPHQYTACVLMQSMPLRCSRRELSAPSFTKCGVVLWEWEIRPRAGIRLAGGPLGAAAPASLGFGAVGKDQCFLDRLCKHIFLPPQEPNVSGKV
jgi:hypothetical protein